MTGRPGVPLRHLIDWGSKPDSFPTSLVERCELALDRAVEHQTPETLRLLIGQHIGLEHLVPVATNLLERDLFVSGDLYEGDLLQNCLRVPPEHWVDHPEQWLELNRLLEEFDERVEVVNRHRQTFLDSNPYGAALP